MNENEKQRLIRKGHDLLDQIEIILKDIDTSLKTKQAD
tara:strand:- start:77 stop:190 length:114 start_codon:yes stop_codon:yes gene_type:complete